MKKIFLLTLCFLMLFFQIASAKSLPRYGALSDLPDYNNLIYAQYALTNNNYPLAIEHYLKIAGRKNNPYFYHLATILAINAGDLSMALMVTKRWLKHFPNDNTANYLMTILTMNNENLSKF